ncbi:MAG: UpxY family transcription antiterminator [Bacteroidota bacterium]
MSNLRPKTKPKTYENHLHATEARWFAVCTSYKHEKRVAQRLAKKNIPHYLPLQRTKKYYTRKVKTVEQPLINCYVFVYITTAQYLSVLETESVVRFLKINRNLLAIPDVEIALLRRIVGEAESVMVDNADSWQAGDAVEVIGGQLTGLQGQLVEKRGAQKLIVSLDTLGMNLQMEVPPKYLRKMPRSGGAAGVH